MGMSPRAAHFRRVLWWTPKYSAATAVCIYSVSLVILHLDQNVVTLGKQLNKLYTPAKASELSGTVMALMLTANDSSRLFFVNRVQDGKFKPF